MFLLELAARVVVFGIALAFATRRIPDVKVTPRSALPFVALMFALANTLLYGVLKFALTIAFLPIFFLVPFLANVALLWLTDKLVKPLKIDGLKPLLLAAAIMTVAHILLRLLHL
jgi:uncharacterized membrane protein YvlD (DUF360 family)